MYDGRKKLKGVTIADLGYQGAGAAGHIFINENLVGATRILLGEVNKVRRDLGYKFLWTYNGKIYVKKNEKAFPIIVHGKEDITKIK